MKSRSFFYTLAAIVLVLLLVSGSGLFWLLSRSPLDLLRGGSRAIPAATIFVPKQAPFVASLLVNPDRLARIPQVLVRPGDRRRAASEIERVRQSLLSGTGLDYRKDIQPWLGEEVTFAITTPDLDRDALNGPQPGYLLAIATQDPEQAREFLQVFWQKQAVAGVDLVFEQYAGVKLIHQSLQPVPEPRTPGNGSSDSEGLAQPPVAITTAMVGDQFVLFANHPKVLREAITNVQAPGLNLDQSESYQAALDSLPAQRVGLAYANMPELSRWLSGTLQTNSLLETSAASDAAPRFDRVVTALKLDRYGLLLETALLTAAGERLQPTRPALTAPVEALRYIPSRSALVAAGTDLNQTWDELQVSATGYPPLAALLNQPIADLQSRWHIDLPDAIFNWVTGEYALGLMPRSDQAGLDWVFVAERSQATEAEAAIQSLDDRANRQGLSVGQLEIAEQPIQAWTQLSTRSGGRFAANSPPVIQAEVAAAHVTVGSYEIFASSLAALESALQEPSQTLLSTATFQQAIAPLSDRNDGYLYVRWPALQPWLEQQFPLFRLVELSLPPLFNHLDGVSLSSYGSDRELRRGGLFLRLAN